jgi:hypothetical protein
MDTGRDLAKTGLGAKDLEIAEHINMMFGRRDPSRASNILHTAKANCDDRVGWCRGLRRLNLAIGSRFAESSRECVSHSSTPTRNSYFGCNPHPPSPQPLLNPPNAIPQSPQTSFTPPNPIFPEFGAPRRRDGATSSTPFAESVERGARGHATHQVSNT